MGKDNKKDDKIDNKKDNYNIIRKRRVRFKKGVFLPTPLRS
jgi:hypothetical protein